MSRYEHLWQLLSQIVRSQSNIKELAHQLDWPEPTVKHRITQLKNIGVDIQRVGDKRKGFYAVISWGPIDKTYVLKRY
ncbi:helix-turn-helix domain-containing protein [Reinekea sp. G2M2-21]|uniref:helix-turn-helix domain-containing protein n=1 Tax=Reinekea sp. G2M2-21 TaxID=2788942 RepID=UPI0018A97EA6|nr:helix-turn-helix domain-containing protein [Reinekea sp. G2M2-21]